MPLTVFGGVSRTSGLSKAGPGLGAAALPASLAPSPSTPSRSPRPVMWTARRRGAAGTGPSTSPPRRGRRRPSPAHQHAEGTAAVPPPPRISPALSPEGGVTGRGRGRRRGRGWWHGPRSSKLGVQLGRRVLPGLPAAPREPGPAAEQGEPPINQLAINTPSTASSSLSLAGAKNSLSCRASCYTAPPSAVRPGPLGQACTVAASREIAPAMGARGGAAIYHETDTGNNCGL